MKRNGIIVLEVLTIVTIIGMSTVTGMEIEKAKTIDNKTTAIVASK